MVLEIGDHGLLAAVDGGVADAVQTLVRSIIEMDGSERPACVIDSLSRLYP